MAEVLTGQGKRKGRLRVIVGVIAALAIVGAISPKGNMRYAPSATQTTAPSKTTGYQTVSVGSVSIQAPTLWKVEESEDGKYVTPHYDGIVSLAYTEEAESKDGTLAGVLDGAKEGFETLAGAAVGHIGDAATYRYPISYSKDGSTQLGLLEVVISGDSVATVTFLVPESSYKLHESEMGKVLDSISVDGPEAPKWESGAATNGSIASQPATSPKGEEASKPQATVSQANALGKAKSYLAYSAFSRDGLIKQLEFEQFSNEDATYGADNCGADWMEQAVKKAKDYLDYSAFSYTGLIGQLEFEGFTHDEAVHGADGCGADWMEQAAKKAADYLDYSSFSRDGLVGQLEFEGFTHEQAEYGAGTTGL